MDMTIDDRIAALDWEQLTARLDEEGFVQTPPVLGAAECKQLAAAYPNGHSRPPTNRRRSRLGEGEYKYSAAPLPEPIERARHGPYPPLAAVANRWAERLGRPAEFP